MRADTSHRLTMELAILFNNTHLITKLFIIINQQFNKSNNII